MCCAAGQHNAVAARIRRLAIGGPPVPHVGNAPFSREPTKSMLAFSARRRVATRLLIARQANLIVAPAVLPESQSFLGNAIKGFKSFWDAMRRYRTVWDAVASQKLSLDEIAGARDWSFGVSLGRGNRGMRATNLGPVSVAGRKLLVRRIG